jgi:ubiquitin-conjugating enzyme E2 J1
MAARMGGSHCPRSVSLADSGEPRGLVLTGRFSLARLRSFMETDPRGQLGGLDTTDGLRKRMAAESPAFRCLACNKTNREIINECEAAVAETALEERAKTDVAIPPELKMAWKDEMGRAVDGPRPSRPSQPVQPSAPLPTPPTPAASTAPTHAVQEQPRLRQVVAEGVPRWLDQVIMALVVVLAGLVINRVFN